MISFTEIEATWRNAIVDSTIPGINQVYDYLKKRGIQGDLIDKLRIHITFANDLIPAARGRALLHSDPRLCVVFPHFDFRGELIPWWSCRLISINEGPKIVNSFADLAEQKPLGKMFCPPQEPPHAYLPPILDWSALSQGDYVYIHESCIKAANGARLGYWSIGLNGVWGFTSRKHELALVEELKSIPWKALKLKPVIVFDSNASSNWDVQLAIRALSSRLQDITGQRARHIMLPKDPEGKDWGFDDYCVHHGDDKACGYLDSAESAEEVEVSELETLKLKLNTEVCVVRSMSRIAEQETGTLMSRASFTDINYAHYTAEVPDGERTKTVNVPRLWLSDPRRTVVEALDYIPGAERISGSSLNLWSGMGLEPQPGSVERWLDILSRNVQDPELRNWVLRWLAYPLQRLGTKLLTYIHFYGPPGVGKQAILYPLMRAYGARNSIIIGKREIQSDFNSVYANKQFINIDEIHGGNDKLAESVNNKMKMLVTGETMLVNTKGQPEYRVRNVANVVSTSNYADAIKLDDDDRRAAVIRFGQRGDNMGKEYWTSYYAWCDAEGSASVYDYLLNVKLDGFDPKGWAPITEDKVEMTRATRRVDDQWVNSLRDDADDVLPPILKGRCLMTGKELAQYCYGEDVNGATPGKINQLGIKLHAAGFGKVELKIDGRKERFWVIRHTEKEWTPDLARSHLKSQNYGGVKK